MFWDKLERLADLNIERIFNEAIKDNKVKRTAVAGNKDRLKDFGFDYEGNKIQTYRAVEQGNQAYSTSYEAVRRRKGKQYNHVDLFMTGAFYRTFKSVFKSNNLMITADFSKPGGSISDNLDTSKLLGFNRQLKDEISIKITFLSNAEIKKYLDIR